MAVRDTTKKPYIADRDDNVFIGIDYPFHKSDSAEGYFRSTETTIKAVKNNIKLLLMTEKGERIMQPTLGLGLRRFLFEQYTPDLRLAIQNEITDMINIWLPFVEIKDLQISMGPDNDVGRNTMTIRVDFNITRDPNTLESVQVEIGE